MIKNTAEFTREELIALFGDGNCHNIDGIALVKGISTDTRNIEPGNMFVALKGENFNGNAKCTEAFHAGAILAMIDRDYFESNKSEFNNLPVIVSDNTLSGLGELGKHHRRRFDIPVLVIGGSNGKTTTKDMISQVLSTKYNLLKTEGNYNNQVGVPLTLLQLTNEHQLAVIECGTNEPGEISILSSIAQPTDGLITNIGREHLEKLIDLDGVEMEETFLFGYLKKHAGMCLINNDDERLKRYTTFLDKRFTFGSDPLSDLFALITINENLKPVVTFKYNDKEYEVNLKTTGYASGLNSIAAIAAGIKFEIEPDDIIKSLESYLPDESHNYARMVLQEKNGIIILNDCYNANPDSMRMSLKTLSAYNSKGKKLAVLGDMREMGEEAEREHLSLLGEAVDIVDFLLVTGTEMCKAAAILNNKKIRKFEDKSLLSAELKKLLRSGDIFLLKGSRGMKMETILDEIN